LEQSPTSSVEPIPQPKLKTDPGISSFGINVILKHCREIRPEIKGIRASNDIEYIHRMRVASRRLRTALDVFLDCLPAKKASNWQSHIRHLTRALGEARDTDTQLELLIALEAGSEDRTFRPGLRRLVLRLSQKRQKLQGKVLNTLDDLESGGVLDQIENRLSPLAEVAEGSEISSPLLFQRSYDYISKQLDELLRFEVYIQTPQYKKELHMMRIAAKRLRYTLEIFAPLYPDKLKSYLQACRETQQLLGEIHDCDVWIDTLPQFAEEERRRIVKFYGNARPFNRLHPGLEFFIKNRQEERERKYQAFLKEWQRWHTKELWLELRRITLAAIPHLPEIPPPTLPPPVV
jgi:CHAD domain-containing protein